MAGPEAVSSRDSLGVQKAPPNSIEAEEALLGSALLSGQCTNHALRGMLRAGSSRNEKRSIQRRSLGSTLQPHGTIDVQVSCCDLESE